ncbi:MAG: hypothetical protein PVH91_13590 [Pseudomonadales bacterium]|jgi:hypothetical protein
MKAHVLIRGPAVMLVVALLLVSAGPAAAGIHHRSLLAGAWYLALDAEPYTGIAGTSLPGLVLLDDAGGFLLQDGGDFGGMPFMTRESAQFGSWRWSDHELHAVTLFLRAASLDGDVQGWARVEFRLRFANRDTLTGTVNVYSLACTGQAPFGVFNCPDPIASSASFLPEGPMNVPVRLQRLRVRLSGTP